MLRPLRAEDRDEVIELVRATGNFNDQEVAIARELIDICVEQPDQGDYFAYVSEVDDRVAGFLLLGPTPATVGTYDMYWIAVHPDFYGQGIAQALDKYAEDFVRERGGYLLIAETSSQPAYERTRGFYTKQKYAILSRIEDYYKPGDDLIVYGKRI
jgi:ribosomal protein S18 acetylase RimI-like enzyme